MKNFLLLSLLTASLAANVWLALVRTRSSDTASATISSSSSGSASGRAPSRSTPAANTTTQEQAGSDARTAYAWNSPGTSNAELRTFAAELRAAGFPPNVIVRFVGEMLRERTHADIAALPHWQLLAPGKETRKQQAAAARELLRLQEEILGPSGAPVATLDPTMRRLQYGDLGDDKVAAVLRIDRDYSELRSELFASYPTVNSDEWRTRQEQFRTVEKERQTDIAAALTPEEFAAWELRESGAAQRVMNALRNVEVSESEYLALFAAQKERDPVSNTSTFVNLSDPLKDAGAAFTQMDKVRATLGDERAIAYLKAADFGYAQVANFAEKNPAVTPAKTFELYKLQNEAQTLMTQARQASESSGGTIRPSEQLQKSFSDLNAKLETLLGGEAAEAYRSQGMGGIFRAFTPPSRPPSAAQTPPKG